MYQRDNLARKEDALRVEKLEEIRRKNLRVVKKKKKISLFKVQLNNTFIATFLVACGLLMISSYGNLTMLSKSQTVLTEKLSTAKSVETSLNSKLNNMFNLGFVEDYATNNLDMIKVDNSQIEYVNIEHTDEVEVSSGKMSAVITIMTQAYYKVMEYMR